MDILRLIIELVLGSSTLLGFLLYRNSNKKIKDAEAEKAKAEAEMMKAEAEKAENNRLLQQLDHQQKTIDKMIALNDSLSDRLSNLNSAVDKHIDRNRELSDRLYKSETDLNIANEKNISLTEDLGNERLLRKHYQTWRCERTDCQDPRGPRPPREKLKGLKYEPPKRAVK